MRFSPGCNCCGCGTIVVTVRLCSDNSLISGATVTVYDDADVEVDSGTTDGTGIVTATIAEAGTYRVVVSKSPHATLTTFVVASCAANPVTVVLGRTIRGWVHTPCGSGLRGLTATFTHATSGRVYVGVTGTEGGSPQENLGIAVAESGIFNYSIPAYRHVTKTGTLTASAFFCVTAVADIELAAESGYHCVIHTACGSYPSGLDGQDCQYPLTDTLFLTDGVYGAVTLTHSGATWVGTKAVTITCGGGAIAATGTWTLSQNSIVSGYILRINFAHSGGTIGGGDPACTGTGDFCPPHVAYLGEFTTAINGAYCSPTSITITE